MISGGGIILADFRRPGRGTGRAKADRHFGQGGVIKLSGMRLPEGCPGWHNTFPPNASMACDEEPTVRRVIELPSLFVLGVDVSYALTFFFVAAAGAVVAAVVPSTPVRVASGWLAATFLVVAVAYATNAAWLLFKRRTGGRWPWAWPMAGPYLLLTEISYRISRKTTPEPGVVPVAENLYLG